MNEVIDCLSRTKDIKTQRQEDKLSTALSTLSRSSPQITFNPSLKLTLNSQHRAVQRRNMRESHLPTRIAIQIFLLISKGELLWVLLLNLGIGHLLAYTLEGATLAYRGRLPIQPHPTKADDTEEH